MAVEKKLSMSIDRFEDITDPLLHGGKSYQLGAAIRAGLPVPPGFGISCEAVEAVVRDGIDSFVFHQNGDHFERVPVHEKYRDQTHVVAENDGALFPGDVVALRGAHQMQMALKSKSGGGIDPHAGHNH